MAGHKVTVSTDIDETLPTEGDIVAGKYLVDKVLGRGGMGLVVGATHQLLDQKVAIKFLTAEAQGELLERFAREARAVAKLKSEYVARVYDVGELEDGTPYMVMEYLDGKDLGDISKIRGALPKRRSSTSCRRATRWPRRTGPASSTAI